MIIPTVTIVGRPNVGKSSLLNCLAKRRISIVEPTSGVTRDRVSTEIQYNDYVFELVDTGGMGVKDVDGLTEDIELQIEIAIHKADIILFVVDIREGVMPLDIMVVEKLRRLNKKVILVANKVDTPKLEYLIADFNKLGLGEAVPISALEGFGRSALLDRIISLLPALPHQEAVPADSIIKLAIVGKRNAGKSTLINTLAKEKRMIVSEVAGTTRDSVDVRFETGGRQFLAIDTAGVRKKRQVKDSIEFYSMARAERSIRRADVVLFLIDATLKVSEVDKKLGDYIISESKPCIIVINKWDLVHGVETERFNNYIYKCLPGLSFAPIIFISAKDNKHVIEMVQLATELYEQTNTRISTSELNQALEEALSLHRPTRKKAKSPRIYYATQVSVAPPTFILFVNDPKLFDSDYERYLSNQLRSKLPFSEIPLKFRFRARTKTPLSHV
ncbi:MAG: ribosome biogenesis GTPase Der [Candidatus Jettenia sp.]|uniref:GTPase Der n=1 Tax=Candidatus Jettenia caeni TaxID=247490 RepID=I3IHA1_9BACT|nr:ribosome biogenesis GTPase Der [Candidatus Jettenia sp. AMX1]MBC6929209.1 ribosome biogenesis GTPase Der [Candidatus Jettenia sp.]WKZ16425.1 MAG: ribosome biogenesis GTPase Der [Candidatus Jettenia caeni]KAA0250165.1 MAG: ribosome biogenesis GTPase Der [Candidatus Jettenia sp. AMX1]MCE7880558.1 ribosome biogenesis GTPase Der [Candidatus Jettenia sp. AMX1]MCQ3927359.1 ribosome biogenesis GTPase Der [Candidatus Jettenia sp.]